MNKVRCPAENSVRVATTERTCLVNCSPPHRLEAVGREAYGRARNQDAAFTGSEQRAQTGSADE